jgi:hypothetical protein
MHIHRVSLFGIVRPIETGGFTNGYRSEGARGRQVIIIEWSSVVRSLISLSSFLALGFFFRWNIGLFIWWIGRSQFLTFGLLKLFLELVNLSLELELLELGGELLHMWALRGAVDGGGLATGTIAFGWRRNLMFTFPGLQHCLSK